MCLYVLHVCVLYCVYECLCVVVRVCAYVCVCVCVCVRVPGLCNMFLSLLASGRLSPPRERSVI